MMNVFNLIMMLTLMHFVGFVGFLIRFESTHVLWFHCTIRNFWKIHTYMHQFKHQFITSVGIQILKCDIDKVVNDEVNQFFQIIIELSRYFNSCKDDMSNSNCQIHQKQLSNLI